MQWLLQKQMATVYDSADDNIIVDAVDQVQLEFGRESTNRILIFIIWWLLGLDGPLYFFFMYNIVNCYV